MRFVFFSSISESTNKNDVTTYSDKFERPIPSKKYVRCLSTITADIIERKNIKVLKNLVLHSKNDIFIDVLH